MLFHVTMTHSEDNCPAYERERMPEVSAAFGKRDDVAKELGVKELFHVWCAPDHLGFLLLEADSLAAVSQYLFTIPIRQDYKVTPVERIEDTLAMARALLERSQARE